MPKTSASALGPQDEVLDPGGSVASGGTGGSRGCRRGTRRRSRSGRRCCRTSARSGPAGRRRPSTGRGLVVHGPGHRVEPVDGLLDDVVAAEPGVVVPVAHLVFHLGLALFPGPPGVPDAGRVVGRLDRRDRPDLAAVDPGHQLASGGVIAPAEAVDGREVLLLRLPGGVQEHPEPRAVDGHRLLDEGVLALLDGVGEVDRPEPGRGGQEDDVDLVDQLLVGVEPDESAVGRDVDPLADGDALEGRVARLDRVAERVGHGHQAFPGRPSAPLGGPGPPTPAADQADLERVARAGIGVIGDVDCGGRGGGRGRGRLEQEGPSGRSRVLHQLCSPARSFRPRPVASMGPLCQVPR